MNQSIKQRENNLKVRGAKVAEIESLAPSVKQLQQMNVSFDMMMSYIILVNERSVLGNISTTGAAHSISHEFKEFRSLGKILKAKQKAEKELAELNTLTAQKQATLNGITERLTQLTGSNYNDNNGHDDLSMTDYIRLNILKSSTTNLLNRI